jgi:putative spermidine/putrescine transport system permease protein
MATTTESINEAPPPEDQRAASETDSSGRLLAADGTPLKLSLARALRRQKLRALALVAPLFLFIVVTFLAPIGDMLFRSVENEIVPETLPRTVAAIEGWDVASGEAPGERVFDAFFKDLAIAAEYKEHTRLGTRLNYQTPGVSSLFRGGGRDVEDYGEVYTDQFEDLNEAWEEASTWVSLMASPDWIAAHEEWAAARDAADEADRDFETPEPAFEMRAGIAAALPETAEMYAEFARFAQVEDEESPAEEEPWDAVFATLYRDLTANPDAAAALPEGAPADLVAEAAAAVPGFESLSAREFLIEEDEEWGQTEVWATIKQLSAPYTSSYFLSAVDLERTATGEVQSKPEDEQIYIFLFERTLFLSVTITLCCLLLGYPIAYLMANLPLRTANLILILVLLPFWTSLLVRTSSWIVLLQQEGVINDFLVGLGMIADDERLQMIFNQTGTIVAMTHILLPFMILPLYSVMKTIPPSYVRAAKSLGATDWTAFWRVYFPNSVPGIGAGAILVFILSIGYYITPELVGGTSGTFISNRIAYHISSSLNWGLAAALASILLLVVLLLYWIYDKLVGIDNLKLG